MATKRTRASAQEADMTVHDLFLKRTDRHGDVTITHHRVWSGERFFNSELKAAKAAGGTVELASRNDVAAARKGAKP